MYMKRIECRSCGAADLTLIYDFGTQPLAGVFPLSPDRAQPARRYPLDLTQCGACGLLQVTYLPPIQEVFHDDYRYSSSTVPDLVRHFEGYADFLTDRLSPGAHVLEFGCNDGVLLDLLRNRRLTGVGVDASDNVAQLARDRGLDVRTGFLTSELVEAEGLAGQFDAVTCSNVFAHIDGIRATVEAVRSLLRPGGLFFIEVHDGEILTSEAQFDTIYHEHLTYFTQATLTTFAAREEFAFVECHKTPMHGGGLRFVGRYEPGLSGEMPQTVELIDGEAFSHTIERCREQLLKLAAQHGPLHGYGAAGRSQMFVNMTRAAECFSIVYDDSPLRQGRYIVGTDIEIRPFEGARGACCVILAWNYAPSIADRVRDHFDKIVTLLPEYQEW
jgi:2-polyprenyl-3-methyl-5-hydroxy-6-metoxy-1,4-benzoquinol methylase